MLGQLPAAYSFDQHFFGVCQPRASTPAGRRACSRGMPTTSRPRRSQRRRGALAAPGFQSSPTRAAEPPRLSLSFAFPAGEAGGQPGRPRPRSPRRTLFPGRLVTGFCWVSPPYLGSWVRSPPGRSQPSRTPGRRRARQGAAAPAARLAETGRNRAVRGRGLRGGPGRAGPGQGRRRTSPDLSAAGRAGAGAARQDPPTPPPVPSHRPSRRRQRRRPPPVRL